MRPSIIWPAFVMGIALTSLSGAAWLIHAAHSDRSFAVEPDYYSKAVRWDETSRQARHNERLGWRIVIDRIEHEHLSVRVLGKDEQPITDARVRATAFANVRASERHALEFQTTTDGAYTARFAPDRSGLWRFRFEVEAMGERFTAEFDQTVIAPAAKEGGS